MEERGEGGKTLFLRYIQWPSRGWPHFVFKFHLVFLLKKHFLRYHILSVPSNFQTKRALSLVVVCPMIKPLPQVRNSVLLFRNLLYCFVFCFIKPGLINHVLWQRLCQIESPFSSAKPPSRAPPLQLSITVTHLHLAMTRRPSYAQL